MKKGNMLGRSLPHHYIHENLRDKLHKGMWSECSGDVFWDIRRGLYVDLYAWLNRHISTETELELQRINDAG